jgi:DNA-binding response OmpR family regulator
VVEDEPRLRGLIASDLAAEGYSVETCHDGLPALVAHRSLPADLLVLDLMLPAMDGFQVLRALRDAGDETPVLILTARGEEPARVQGFQLGADDYLVKPFSILELLGRVKAILRRARKAPEAKASRFRSGPFVLDRGRLGIQRDGAWLDLGIQRVRLLEVLWRRSGHTLARTELLNLAWEPDARPGLRTVDVHVAQLRKQLGEEWIVTVEGIGYRWTAPVEPLD